MQGKIAFLFSPFRTELSLLSLNLTLNVMKNLSKHKSHEKQEMIDIEHKKKYDNKKKC